MRNYEEYYLIIAHFNKRLAYKVKLSLHCIVLKGKRIAGYKNARDLLALDTDQLFIIDYDSLVTGYLNLKLYTEISKFFEIVVMNFPERGEDLMDSFVSGASRVVISDELPFDRIRSFLEISEDLVMKYGDTDKCRFFSRNGGDMYLSSREIDLQYSVVYYYGAGNVPENYVRLVDFPETVSGMI